MSEQSPSIKSIPNGPGNALKIAMGVYPALLCITSAKYASGEELVADLDERLAQALETSGSILR